MDNNFYVYRHIRKDTNKPFYIGLGSKPKKFNNISQEYKRAFSDHSRSKFWKSVVAKTGYEVQIIFECGNLQEAREKEIEFISLYGRRDLKKGTLVNMTDGGEGTIGRKVSKETKQLMSERLSGRVFTTTTKLKMSKSAKIKKFTEETKLKMSQAQRGKRHTEESKQKMSQAQRGRKVTEKTRQKLSQAKKGKRSKDSIILDLESGIYYNTLMEACAATTSNYNTANTRIRRKLKNIRLIKLN